jgi:uncharacterized membrane protein
MPMTPHEKRVRGQDNCMRRRKRETLLLGNPIKVNGTVLKTSLTHDKEETLKAALSGDS